MLRFLIITFLIVSGILFQPLPARAETVYVNYTSILSDTTPVSYRSAYRSIMENFRVHHTRIPFPQGATAIAASYRRFDSRDIYNAVETYSYLEILNGADPAHPLDSGSNAAGDRRKRLRDLIAWNLWLMSREGVNHHWNNPHGDDGPWLEGRLRGWGSKNFRNSSSDFKGWHTYSEQTSQPLIGLFQTALAIESYLRQHPEFARERVFAPSETDAFRQSGYMTFITPAVTGDTALNGCVAARDACRYDYGNLTFGEAATLLRTFGGGVLDWWIAHAMTRHEGLAYFWYTSRGDGPFASTGIPARDWFIVHANMLMGRAAFLYATLTGEPHYSDISVQLYRAFLTAHHKCRKEWKTYSCYHYGVLGKPLAALVGEGDFGAADPVHIKTTAAGALEEPYHMNSSQALVGLINGSSLLNNRDLLETDGEWLPLIHDSYRAAYSNRVAGGPCPFFTAYQCNTAFVTGPPRLARAYNWYWKIGKSTDTLPREALTLNGTTFSVPHYAQFGDALAAFYLAEGATDESFELLYQWWDGYARRVEFGNRITDCVPKQICRNAFDGSNFPKMGAFLAAAAFRNQGAVALPPPARPRRSAATWSCASTGAPGGGGGAGDWLWIGVVVLLFSAYVNSPGPRSREPFE